MAAQKKSMFSRLSSAFSRKTKHDVRLLVVGLDNSGKTTVINQLKPGVKGQTTQSNEVTPTVGFSLEEFSNDNLNLTVFDMSGQSRYRSLWEHYYRDVQAIIYVLDSTDRARMCVAKDEMDAILGHKDIEHKDIPILFFANKMDLPGAMEPVDIVDQLELHDVEDKPWHITSSNALTGEGIEDGVAWMTEKILEFEGHK